MGEKKLRIFTCSPCAFMGEGVAPHLFFCRDMGLQCHTLRKLGHESQVVLLKAANSQSHPDVIRATMKEMESVDWWRIHQLDAVIMGSWASPKYTGIAKAIRKSGAKLIIRCDTGGSLTQRYDPLGHTLRMNYYYAEERVQNVAFRLLYTALATGVNFLPFYRERRVVDHLSYADCVIIETPKGAANLRRLLQHYGINHSQNIVHYVPHLVDDEMVYDDEVGKQKCILSIGTWKTYPKNAPLLIRCLSRTLRQHKDYKVFLVGSGAEYLEKLVDELGSDIKNRIHILGVLKHSELVPYFQMSNIYFIPSRREGSSISAQEALCCGMSVVGSKHLNCVKNFISKDSGTMSPLYTEHSLTMAMNEEIECWENGLRSPSEISDQWLKESLAVNITNKILKVSGVKND